METSILQSTKKILGISADDTSFDQDVLTHINSVFSTLTQDLGVGPSVGFVIEDDTPEWADFTEDVSEQSSVKTYVYLKVRLLFDPPATSYLLASFEKQLEQVEWRISVNRESTDWVDPDPPVIIEEILP